MPHLVESNFYGRTLTQKPRCPYCDAFIEKPKELNDRRPVEMPVGSCSCSAVYACDETGHNLGSAMIEALTFGCNMDWDLAWDLMPDEDYHQEIMENYDYANHLIVPGGSFEGRRISGALFFVKLHEEVWEVTAEGVRKRLEKATPGPVLKRPSPGSGTQKESFSKQKIEKLVREFEIAPILKAATQDKKLIKNLQRLLYTGDDLFRLRAAETLGRVSAIIAEKNPGAISKLLQILFYAITDTAAFTWGAFEAIGQIIAHKAELFSGYAPQLYQFLPNEALRAQVLQTVGTIAKARPDLFRKHAFHFLSFLTDPDFQVRGYTAWILGNLAAHEAREGLENLRGDSFEIGIYDNGNLQQKSVGQVASEALEKLGALK